MMKMDTSTKPDKTPVAAICPEPSSPSQKSTRSTDSSMEASEAGLSSTATPRTDRRGSVERGKTGQPEATEDVSCTTTCAK